MAEFDEGVPRPDRLAIAQQVIKSAGDVLRAAGFTRGEIGSFFRQAADHLLDATTDSGDEVVPSGNRVLERLVAEIASSPPGREIDQLNAQIIALGLPGREAPLAGHFDLAMKMIPLIAEAQNALRRVATGAGLQVFADRRDAADSLPDAGALYFDDFQSVWSNGFHLIATLLANLSERGDEEAFAFLLESMLENGVVISFELREAIERAAQALPPRQAL